MKLSIASVLAFPKPSLEVTIKLQVVFEMHPEVSGPVMVLCCGDICAAWILNVMTCLASSKPFKLTKMLASPAWFILRVLRFLIKGMKVLIFSSYYILLAPSFKEVQLQVSYSLSEFVLVSRRSKMKLT